MRCSTYPRPRRAVAALLAAATVAASIVALPSAASAGTSSIGGTAFEDANRNGAVDADEPVWSGQQIYLFDSTGRNVAVAWTDPGGNYSFRGLVDGDYRVAYASPSWAPLKMDWTPTTTGTWRPSRTVQLVSEAQVDFGWRRIVRTSDLDHPISSYRAANGLTVQMYNDAVAPEEVAQLVAAGSLIGTEAASVTVRVDGSQYTATGSSYGSTNGTYSGYRAIATIDWLTWVTAADNALFHEYGHAWSGYFSVMVQQDPYLTGYLRVRGLEGDPRVDGSYGWSRYELVAEDYRQLFGTPEAQAGGQANGELPPAAAVPGLRDYLATTFLQPPASPTPPPDTEPAPAPSAVEVTGLAVSPRPVVKSGKVTYSIDRQAAVTVTITSAGGAVVRTLASQVDQAVGGQSLTWDRRDAKGRRVAAGTYTVRVDATAEGATGQASVDFPVA